MSDVKGPEQDAPGRARQLQVGPDALKAMTHPLRMALYTELQRRRSATASELARALGESSGQTSYHLRQLERFGFVEDDPDRPHGRERWWRTVGFNLDTPELFTDPATAESARDVVHRIIAERAQVLTAWADSLSPGPEDRDNQVMAASTIDLTPSERSALIAELMAVLDRYSASVRGRTMPPDAERTRVHLDVVRIPPGVGASI